MVIYGCMSGKAPPFRWDSWVFREVQACSCPAFDGVLHCVAVVGRATCNGLAELLHAVRQSKP